MPRRPDPPLRLAPLLAAASLVLAGLAPSALAQEDGMTQAEFEAALSEMQAQAKDAVDAYERGDREAALAHARNVTARFSFESGGASPLERAIKNASAVHIGDRVKGLSSQLLSAVESNASVEEVREIGDDLTPNLNRLVLVAQGKTAPASKRQLKTPEGVEAARQEVMAQVNRSVALYEQGDADEAKAQAREAFFTFETNGLGPDSSVVDEPLENRAENLIVNFQDENGSEPGLADLIEQGAPLEDVREKRDEIANAMGQVADLLVATLPPRSLGDANQDGDVSIVDALLVSQAALGVRQTQDIMDANQDGSVTIVDALLVAQAALGVRTL